MFSTSLKKFIQLSIKDEKIKWKIKTFDTSQSAAQEEEEKGHF